MTSIFFSYRIMRSSLRMSSETSGRNLQQEQREKAKTPRINTHAHVLERHVSGDGEFLC